MNCYSTSLTMSYILFIPRGSMNNSHQHHYHPYHLHAPHHRDHLPAIRSLFPSEFFESPPPIEFRKDYGEMMFGWGLRTKTSYPHNSRSVSVGTTLPPITAPQTPAMKAESASQRSWTPQGAPSPLYFGTPLSVTGAQFTTADDEEIDELMSATEDSIEQEAIEVVDDRRVVNSSSFSEPIAI